MSRWGSRSKPACAQRCFAFALLALSALALNAAPVNKCLINGSVSYQQDPCPSSQARKDPSIEALNAEEQKKRRTPATSLAPASSKAAPQAAATAPGFACDKRKYCSQMRSCEEAKYFLAHCPGVSMDGDRDGIPCEEQWCGHQ
ncbi:excalibur calcium-binding domain-containing protein [Paucibacter sp. Y2R2-4]|uniref:excalibur calcium-binding domain-containing protein n=1 Tax=Paucibacter sp. Y2R2-4 TaxID=2893553 RepID=UPI0021E3AD1D|nr:excalibur calcium-binding domain-containing protein [Paucibacter sp. Y2R2-4]MCV2351554.1 excalibur calcium-binding domain-containing protein [Paucibacter sp. Y2R2-4]